ncbi:hypothetical protein BJ508DRAFT_76230 [Ascobolus immersus RN42]|uniref:Zn(2)-C6 fungal-type domain-containing protein n=1 Tax=Ascobolus immersus RN42 TaxID=1160509 RepID=A0A3N4HRL1_ASCIM|nr:hypothetical protein BJ508DRAFT_76230 [Ascobolus immersus RN42]
MKRPQAALPAAPSQTSSSQYTITTPEYPWPQNSATESMRYGAPSTYVPLSQGATGGYEAYSTSSFTVPMSTPPTTSATADYRRHSEFTATSLSGSVTHLTTDMGNPPTVSYSMENRQSRLQTTPPLHGSRRHSTYQPTPTVHQQRQQHHQQHQHQQQQQQQQPQHHHQQQQHQDQISYDIQTSSPAISQAYTQTMQPAMVQPVYSDNSFFQSSLGSTSVSMDLPTMPRASPITDNSNNHWAHSQAVTESILFSDGGLQTSEPETCLPYYPHSVDSQSIYHSPNLVVNATSAYQRLPSVSAPAFPSDWTTPKSMMRVSAGNDNVDTVQPQPRRLSSNSDYHQHQRYPTASPRMLSQPQHSNPMIAPAQEQRQPLKRKYSAVATSSPVMSLEMVAQSRRESTELAVEEDNSLNSILGRSAGTSGGAFHVLRIPDPQQGAGELGADGRETVQLKKKTKRPAPDHERAETKLKREEGVCFRCKIYKERCRGGLKDGPCERCSKISGPWKEICCSVFLVHSAVLGKKLYRERVVILLENVESWGTGSTKKIQVSNGYNDLFLDLDVRDFKPRNKSLLDHVFWRETNDASFDKLGSSAYGLAKHDEEAFSKEALDTYLDGHVGFLLDEMKGRQNRSYMLTLSKAYGMMQRHGHSKGGLLIRKVFRIWAAINLFFHKPWRIVGADKFGMKKITTQSSKLQGIYPLPRLLNQQLDSIVENRIEELEKEALKDLQEMALKHQDGSESYVLYLSIFVYLCGLERDTWCLEAWRTELARQSKAIGVGSSKELYLLKWPLEDDPSKHIERNKLSAKYISHYTQSIFRGGLPFGPANSKPATTLNKSGTEAKEYREEVANLIQRDGRAILPCFYVHCFFHSFQATTRFSKAAPLFPSP